MALRAAGHICVAILEVTRRLPIEVTETLLQPALTIYPWLRTQHAARLRACFAASPFPSLSLKSYYRSRLKLLLLGLKEHGRALQNGNPSDAHCPIDGLEHYTSALKANRPVVLLGLHAGELEKLHRVPAATAGIPFLILTTPAFSPPLTAYMARGRGTSGKRVIWTGSTTTRSAGVSLTHIESGVQQLGLEAGIRSVLASRGVLAIMVDQHPGLPEELEFLTLWGTIKVPYPARLLQFLDRQGCQCLPVSTYLGQDGVSRFRFHPVLASPSPDRIQSFLEDAIAQAPEQWNWSYPKVNPVKG